MLANQSQQVRIGEEGRKTDLNSTMPINGTESAWPSNLKHTRNMSHDQRLQPQVTDTTKRTSGLPSVVSSEVDLAASMAAAR